MISISHQILFGKNNYFIYKDGKVENIKTGRFLKCQVDKDGYRRIGLHNGSCGKRIVKYFKVHRLLAIAYIPNPLNKPQIDHINRDRSDNRLCNLRWVTVKENANNRTVPKHYNVKVGKSGEKYINILEYGAYKVRIDQHNINKTFKTLEEAVIYRDEMCIKYELPNK